MNATKRKPPTGANSGGFEIVSNTSGNTQVYIETSPQMQAKWLAYHRRVSAALANTIAFLAFGEVCK
jgi:hypothetical protein